MNYEAPSSSTSVRSTFGSRGSTSSGSSARPEGGERKLGAWVGDRRSRAATLTPERMEHLSETGVRRGVAGAGSEQSICLTQMFVSTDAQVAAILDFLHGENAAYDAPDATR